MHFCGNFHNLYSECTCLKYWLHSQLFMTFLKMGHNHHLGSLLNQMTVCVHYVSLVFCCYGVFTDILGKEL